VIRAHVIECAFVTLFPNHPCDEQRHCRKALAQLLGCGLLGLQPPILNLGALNRWWVCGPHPCEDLEPYQLQKWAINQDVLNGFRGLVTEDRIWVDVACLGVEDDLPSNNGLGMLARRRISLRGAQDFHVSSHESPSTAPWKVAL
jgi:hypothetical protein